MNQPPNQPPAPQYAQQPPPGYYPPQPPKKSHTARNILIAFAVLFLLGVGGCFAAVGLAANEVGKSIDKQTAADKQPGGPDNPMKITEGKAFEVSGFNYADGWRINATPYGIDIKGLKVTNNRGEKDSALVEIKFMRGNEVAAVVDCTTEPIQPEQTTTLSCLSGDKLPKGYDQITINDTF